MKLGIFSDTHLGFGNDERFEEAFQRFEEALKIFKEKEVDFILHAGDLFDSSTPSPEVWLKALNCFDKNNSSLSEITKIRSEKEINVKVKGIPIIAIHGTHEHRGKDFANALDILERANCLVHVHAGYAILEKDDERVYVHGMGGIPEKFAKEALQRYAPKPLPESRNLLLLHQSFTEFLPFGDDAVASLSLSDLPEGFDLIINGHLHWVDEQKIGEKRFLLTGSTIYTQMKSLESEKGKGIFFIQTEDMKLDFVPFEKQRRLFYKKIKFDSARPEEIISEIESFISSIPNDLEMKPLVRLKLVGTIAKGFSQKDIQFSLPDIAIFSLTKKFETEGFKKRIDDLKELQKQKKNVLDFGISLLEKKVVEAELKDFDVRRIFELLSENELDKAQRVLIEE
jgi:DNA repair protein SbcD/Mre11